MKKSELSQLIHEEIEKIYKEGFQGDEPDGDGLSGFRGGASSTPLSDPEILKLLMEIWEKIPLGSRMNEGGMPRVIPLQIRDLLNKKGYTIIKK